MKKTRKIIVYTLEFNGQTMYSTSKKELLDEIDGLLEYIGSPIAVSSTVRSQRWYNALPAWKEWDNQ